MERKKPGPAPTGKGEPIVTRLQPDQIAALDALIAVSGGGLSRPAMLRDLLAVAAAPRRDPGHVDELRRWEARMADPAGFWAGKPDGLDNALRRFWFTGATDVGGPVIYDDDYQRREAIFDRLWKRDPETARRIDWRRFS